MSFETAIQTALDAAQTAAGGSIVYRRGAQSAAVKAMRTHPQMALNRDSPATVIAGEVDWIIQRAALVVGGQAIEPQAGDLIDDVVDALTYTYEVQPTDGGHESQDLDPYHLAWRIHSKLMGIA